VNLFLNSTQQLMNYQTIFTQLDRQLFLSEGKNVKIAILDTGFFLDHPDLSHLKSHSVIKDFGGNQSTVDMQGHGTQVLGVMAAKNAQSNIMKGMVPEAEFFLYKVIRENFGFIDSFATKAIHECIEQNVDIINMSFNVPSSENSLFHQAVLQAIANNIKIVAAAGEDANLVQQSFVFPAQFKDVISVGVLSKDFVQDLNLPFNSMLDFVMPFINIKSSWINDASGLYREEKGSSMASALITGILAGMLGSGISAADLISNLKEQALLFNSQIFSEQELQIIKL
jgi:subtilisin family serine protease